MNAKTIGELDFVAASRLRGQFTDPRRAVSYQFAHGDGKSLLVAWTGTAWRCVYWFNSKPIDAADEEEATAMCEAEARAEAMWEEEQQAQQRLRLVA